MNQKLKEREREQVNRNPGVSGRVCSTHFVGGHPSGC